MGGRRGTGGCPADRRGKETEDARAGALQRPAAAAARTGAHPRTAVSAACTGVYSGVGGVGWGRTKHKFNRI